MLHDLGAEVVVADDAFQHRRMGRDLDIVLTLCITLLNRKKSLFS